MPLTFSFALSQQHSFTLRCPFGSRGLDRDELTALIDQCKQQYYPSRDDLPADLVRLGRRLFAWLDGKEGWLRRSLDNANAQTLYLDLIQTSEAAQLNPATERVALGLAHLPWELLHDGIGFLVARGIVPVRLVQQRPSPPVDLPNRPLRLLLMATSPENIQPVLSYEQEEANILEATEKQPLALVVEESGSVAELGDLVASYAERHFDVFHLTGHGLIFTQAKYGSLLTNDRSLPEQTPCFITEDAVGAVQLTTVADLAQAFGSRWCPVIFLSGCHTGEVPGKGTVPSMAQALVKAGAGVVLGWARPVYDHTGIVAAQVLYRELATGATIEAAVRETQQELWRQYQADPRQHRCSDWHLLRLYCSGQTGGLGTGQSSGLGQPEARSQAALVTPLRTARRERLRLAEVENAFLDANRTVKVASRREFVGRRRPLQRCLRALRETSDQTGVWLAGMGGLGKSTLAARLCTRVQAQRPQMQTVVVVGVVDEVRLVNQLSSHYERFANIPALLNDLHVSLKGRLQNFFDAIEGTHDQPLLLVLDDFEQNIPDNNRADGSMRLSAEAYRVLEALCAALEESHSSRLLVTCRYLEPATLPPHRLHLERLLPMNAADFAKKRRLLPTDIQTTLAQDPPLQERILTIADGNPRLLEWLTAVLPAPEVDADPVLTRLEQAETRFREDILAETLINALSPPAQKALAQLSVFRLPVPAALVADLPTLARALTLGLVEQTPDPVTYRVPTILDSLLQPRLSADQWQQTRQQAAQQTYALWWETEDKPTEERSLEMVRLALLAGERDIAVTVGSRLTNRWVNSARYGEAISLCETILAQFEDVQLLLDLARAEKVVGRVTQAMAHYEQALALCPEDDTAHQSAIWFNQAELLLQQGDVARAITLYEQSLQLLEQINDVKGKAASLHALAGIYAQQGDVARAITLYEQSLQLKEQINDVQGKAASLHALAGIYAQQGDVARAITLYEQSLQLKEQINDAKGKAASLHALAGIYAQQGDVARAITLYEQSLQLKEQINDVQGKAASLHALAGIYAQQGDVARAITLYEQSLQLKEQINDAKGKAASLHALAGIYAQQGDVARVITLYEQSLQLDEQINDVQGKAASLHALAGIYAQQGDVARAITLYEQSQELLEQINDVKGKAATLANLAYWAGETGDRVQQFNLNLQAAKALGEAQAYVDLFTVLGNLGATAEESPQIYLAQALWLALRIQVPLPVLITRICNLYNQVPQGNAMEALLAATALLFCAQQQAHPQHVDLQETSLQMRLRAAAAQGVNVEDSEAFGAWWQQQQLNDPEVFVPSLQARLEALVGDGWLFERDAL